MAQPQMLLPGYNESDEEKYKIARKRDLAQALKAASLARDHSPTINTGMYHIPDWGSAISKVAQAYFGDKYAKEADTEAADYARGQNHILTEGLGRYEAKRSGVPGAQGMDTRALDESGAEGAGPNAADSMPGIAPDRMGAIVDALKTGHPGLRDLAMEDFKGMRKTQDPMEFAKLPGAEWDPESIKRGLLGGGPNALQPKKKFREVNGQMVPENEPGDYRTQYHPPQPAANGLPPMQVDETGKATGLTGGNVTPPQPGVTRSKEVEQLDVKTLEEGRKQAIGAMDALQYVADAHTLLNKTPPQAFGQLSNLRLIFNKTLEGLGGKPLPETANVESMKQAFGQQLIEHIRKFAPVTENDIKTMESILGSTSNTADAMRQALNYTEMKAAQAWQRHKDFVGQMQQEPGSAGVGKYGVPVPGGAIHGRDPPRQQPAPTGVQLPQYPGFSYNPTP